MVQTSTPPCIFALMLLILGLPNGCYDVEEDPERVVYPHAVGVKERNPVRVGKGVIG